MRDLDSSWIHCWFAMMVPAVIAAGGIWFNRQQRQRELEIAEQRAQDEVLQAYLDQMSQMLTDKERPLRRAQPGDDLSVVARARTLTVLARLVDPEHKGSVVQFLYESGLITRGRRFLDLSKAELFMADLRSADLRSANLLREYYQVFQTVNEFDKQLLTVKGWGVTLSLAALAWGFQYAHYGLFLVAALSGLAFWLNEGVMKRH